MVALFDDTDTPAETARLRERLQVFAKIFTLISLFGIANPVLGAEFHPRDQWASWYWVLYFALYLALWLATRSPARSHRQLRALELGTIVGVSLLIYGHAQLLPKQMTGAAYAKLAWVEADWLEYLGLLRVTIMSSMASLGLGMVLLLRAALIPARPLYTALSTLVAYVPMFAAAMQADYTPAGVPGHVSREADILLVSNMISWGLVFVLACTGLSATIYRLRREARAARDAARQLGQYTLQGKLGAGGMGEVYRAKHAMMRRPTAVKLVTDSRAHPERLLRFEREVQQTARLSHPNTITIYDYGRTREGDLYYAMELLEGATLGRVVAHAGALPPARVIHVMRALCGALEEAHAIGLIHRDIKPGNIFLCSQGGQPDVPKLLDFGLVKELEGARENQLDESQQLIGTPLYLSPEAIERPDELDQRSDIYCLGAVAYYMLTATPPFTATTLAELCARHLYAEPDAPSERLGQALSADLQGLVLRCSSKDPAARPQSAVQLAAELEACAESGGWTLRDRRAWWAEHGTALEDDPDTVSLGYEQTVAVATPV